MKARIDTAVSKGCDGVDPDNGEYRHFSSTIYSLSPYSIHRTNIRKVDGYDNGGGGFSKPLKSSDSIAFMKKLSTYAHSQGLAIGLKNAGAIVEDTLSFLDWSVNEQCVQYTECDTFSPFISAGKPVFHIEYLDQSSDVQKDCYGPDTTGFSTILKQDEDDLPAAVQFCPAKSK